MADREGRDEERGYAEDGGDDGDDDAEDDDDDGGGDCRDAADNTDARDGRGGLWAKGGEEGRRDLETGEETTGRRSMSTVFDRPKREKKWERREEREWGADIFFV